MAKKKNAGFYARGAVPRRSADRKAGHALRLFLKEESENETLFWKCHNYGDNFDALCPAGLYRLVGREPLQYSILGAPGLFPLISVPAIVGCVGALLIIVAAIATPIAKTQKMREAWFYVMSSGVVLKIVTMEIARIIF